MRPIINPIARAWGNYEKTFLQDSPLSVRREVKRAFFAGAGGMFQYVVTSLSMKDMTEELHAHMMRQIKNEMEQFSADVKAGKE